MVQNTTVLSATQTPGKARATPKVLQFLSRRQETTKKVAETWSKHTYLQLDCTMQLTGVMAK